MLTVKRDGAVTRITARRPQRGNAFTDKMIDQLAEAVERAGAHSTLIVITGAGKDFCAGRDASPAPDDPLARRQWAENVFRCYGTLRDSLVPVLAVVRGRAFGFGCAIAALSDITLASEEATFQVPEMAHNIMPGNVLSAFVDRVPRKAMAYLVLGTQVIGAAEAQACGIVSAVASGRTLDSLARTVTKQILVHPPEAVRAVKEYMRRASDMPIAGAVDFARNLHATVNASAVVRKHPRRGAR
jgi:enoyl-CoA hydratase